MRSLPPSTLCLVNLDVSASSSDVSTCQAGAPLDHNRSEERRRLTRSTATWSAAPPPFFFLEQHLSTPPQHPDGLVKKCTVETVSFSHVSTHSTESIKRRTRSHPKTIPPRRPEYALVPPPLGCGMRAHRPVSSKSCSPSAPDRNGMLP